MPISGRYCPLFTLVLWEVLPDPVIEQEIGTEILTSSTTESSAEAVVEARMVPVSSVAKTRQLERERERERAIFTGC